MVIKEYRCVAHDLEFESGEENPPCPSGCHPKFVVREFRTPPSIGSDGGRMVDRYQQALANDYGLTDMRNDRGQSVMEMTRRESGGRRSIPSQSHAGDIAPEQRATWAPSIFNPGRGWAASGEVPKFDFGSSGLKGPGGIAQTRPQLKVASQILSTQTVVEKRWKQ